MIARALRELALRAEVVLTTGGTGVALRDVTPEATLDVCERLVPGVAELLRREGFAEMPYAALGRECGGPLWALPRREFAGLASRCGERSAHAAAAVAARRRAVAWGDGAFLGIRD
ncbi:molybdopterin-binding protein [Amaricoccus sp.]|uniref:molybdopterin-binding protein n=1 Tax=Amaricoccus sp. TaxID=1872485 RepID=UPI0039E5D77B